MVSQTYSVDVGLLNKWKRNRATLQKLTEKSDLKNEKKNRSVNNDSDDALYNWRIRARSVEICISGPILCAEALAFNKEIGGNNKFKASSGLNRQQVFNSDETGLVYKDMPEKTIASNNEVQVSGSKKKKEKVSVRFCYNANGSMKMLLLVIGKSKNPRKLKSLQKSKLPVIYDHQNNAWMDKRIFRD
ncbi:jerky protein homolog [Chelonus insularis]|uniref:jerky protein homolog n=1 Tax=Chelonus insularis TaxID=460826 RepID=UPI00158D7C80|nr:jerky protein homolog [Chelonus insularis]